MPNLQSKLHDFLTLQATETKGRVVKKRSVACNDYGNTQT